MRSGQLRHFITIKTPQESKNSYGEKTFSYIDFLHCWSDAKPIKTTERFVSSRLNTEVNYQFRIRYVDGVEHNMRVIFGTRVFDIDSILNVNERNRELIILASEVFDD